MSEQVETVSIDRSERKHHPYGPSRVPSLYACPASAKESAGEPELSSDEADRGTLCHDATERRDFSRLEKDEDVEAVQAAIDFLHELAPDEHWRQEEFFQLYDDDPKQTLTYGWADAYAVFPDRKTKTIDFSTKPEPTWYQGYIVDFKFGWSHLPAEFIMKQLGIYAAMLLEKYDVLEQVVALAYYPRMGRKLELRVDRQQLPGMLTWFRTMVEACEQDQPVYAIGPQCAWCRGIHKCPKVAGEDMKTELALLHPLDLQSPERLARAMECTKALESWIERVKTVVRTRMGHGIKVPGWKLQPWSKRYVKDTLKLAVRSVGLLTTEELLSQATIPIGKLESLWVKKQGMHYKTQKEAKESMATTLGDVIQKTPETTRLVRG